MKNKILKKKRHYGQENYGNLLGTIKSLDELGVISLNCTEIAGKKVHDELLHCEWGLISRLGWNVINDTTNWVLDSNDWWAGLFNFFKAFFFWKI